MMNRKKINQHILFDIKDDKPNKQKLWQHHWLKQWDLFGAMVIFTFLFGGTILHITA